MQEIFFRNVKRIRYAISMTQSEAAKRSGLSRSYYSQVENGYRVPSFSTVSNMAQALGIELWQLVKPYEDGELEIFCEILKSEHRKYIDK